MSVNSSNSDFDIHNRQQQFIPNQNFKPKKIKDYVCPCGRSYGSYPALYSHIKRKHDGKPPGEVIKPKPLRRRGRPFKYEPINLQNQNPHKTASRHLEQYLRNVQNEQLNQFPLKDFANQLPQKLNFIYPVNDQEQYIRYQYIIKKSRQNQQNWSKDDERHEQGQRQSNIPNINQHFQSENYYSFVGNSNPYEVEHLHFEQKRMPMNQLPSLKQIKGMQDPRTLRNPNISLPNGGLNNEFNQFFRVREQQKRRRVQYEQQRYDVFESIYSKPYELELKQQMQEKFNPIAQGMSQFLQPILRELINRQQRQMREKVINIEDDEQDRNGLQPRVNEVGEVENGKQHGQNRQVNVNNINEKQQVNNNENGQKGQVQCRQLLQNQHLRDIVRWMMSPPQQLTGSLGKENYIENSFRCCLVQFLDFSNQFLQKVQYQQILLVFVFFCDHILASTGSFQNRPQPLVYEMFMYFNSFLSQYIPKLSSFMPALNRLFIFVEYKKKISELFMWMSTWQSIQQYYHNRYFRERIIHQLQQQNLKSLQYQQKYNMYISQAQKQNVFSQTINNTYPLQSHIEQQIILPQQKTQQNPQPILFSHNINNINPQVNLMYTQNYVPQQQHLNQHDAQEHNLDNKDENNVNNYQKQPVIVKVPEHPQVQQQKEQLQKDDNINNVQQISKEINQQANIQQHIDQLNQQPQPVSNQLPQHAHQQHIQQSTNQ